ncbi:MULTISPECIES: helix-turn-helix domain-containing protein [Xenorhabdus]|uniref:helix-turn-helix domain-containing protein n=1 Tax=Xenorhabdus TaxID=626 RepID=UPI0030CAFB38
MNNVKNDWYQADIIAALRKGGTTLAVVSRETGLSSSTLTNILSRPWLKFYVFHKTHPCSSMKNSLFVPSTKI